MVPKAWSIVLATATVLVASPARTEEGKAGLLERPALLAEVVRSHPAVRAAEQRAVAQRHAGEAEGSLPPPEAMVQVWQVPIAKPYAVGDAQMIMFGVGQSIPAPGSRGARQRAAEHEATAERAMGEDRAREIRRAADHAFADYVEAVSRHRVHVDHRLLAGRTVDLARARHAGGGSLADVAQAEVDLARVDADVVTDVTRIDAARARLNALLGAESSRVLPMPAIGEPETTSADVKALLAKARETRPELRGSAAQWEARREEAHAAEKEAALPSFNLAALYFAPTSLMPHHGYGVNASMTLPWLWGEAASRRDAKRAFAGAAESDHLAAQRTIGADVATQEATVRASALRLVTLRESALPASRRAYDVAWAGYETSRVDVLRLLGAQRMVVDVESEIIAARALLDHALAELDAAVGAEVPRRKLGTLAQERGGGHAG